MNTNFSYLFKYKLFTFKIKRRKMYKKRRRSKHLNKLFTARRKRFFMHYQYFDSKISKRNLGSSSKAMFESSKKKKYRIGLKSLEYDLIRLEPLTTLKFCTQRFLRSRKIQKKTIKSKLNVFPNAHLTQKPKSVRMGKGKGETKLIIAFLNKNKDLFNIKFIKKYFGYKIKKKRYLFKICLFVFFLMKILKQKTKNKNVIYKKIY